MKNELKEYILQDIYERLRMARYENAYISTEELAETIIDALGTEDASQLAKEITNFIKCFMLFKK